MSYVEIVVYVWGLVGGWIVDFVIVSLLYCSCVLMVMVFGSSFMELFKELVMLNLKEWCLICVLVMLFIVFIKRLFIFVWLSMLVVVVVFIIVFILLGFILGDLNFWILDKIFLFNINIFLVSLGIVMFLYCGYIVFFGIEGFM